MTGGGIEVEFFGEKARMMPARPRAVQTGAALLPVTLWFEDSGWGAQIYDEIPVPPEGTRREKVAAMTQQWLRCTRRASGPTRRTGTCCSRCSPPISTWTGWPGEAREAAAGAARGEDSTPVGGGGP